MHQSSETELTESLLYHLTSSYQVIRTIKPETVNQEENTLPAALFSSDSIK